jgi:hypothetical protein
MFVVEKTRILGEKLRWLPGPPDIAYFAFLTKSLIWPASSKSPRKSWPSFLAHAGRSFFVPESVART